MGCNVCTQDAQRQNVFLDVNAGHLLEPAMKHLPISHDMRGNLLYIPDKNTLLIRSIPQNSHKDETASWHQFDSRLSEKRDMDAAHPFFKQALSVVGHAPASVTTDGYRSSPRAVRETFGDDVEHQTNKYLNNRREQDHRGIKQRYSPRHGFGNVVSAARFCHAFDE